MSLDHAQCYRAVLSRDARFDGVFFTGVRTTGIYCRPSCPAVTPKPENVSFHRSAAAAQEAGLRACRRCRPDTTPGSPEWDVRADAVGRAMQMIGDGVVEREGVDGLAARLGYSARHVARMLQADVGASTLALARSERAHTARVLIETTAMTMSDIAFAAGFASIRQFNDSIRQVYAMTPTQMRGKRRLGALPAGRIVVRLALRRPFHAQGLLDYLGARAITGVENVTGRTYARVCTFAHGAGVVELTLYDDHVDCELELHSLRDTATAARRCRRLLDLDADPAAIADVLETDPDLAPYVAGAPGLRLPVHTDGFEVAVRAIVGQQISVARARTILGRYAADYGAPVSFELAARHGLTTAFPTAERFTTTRPEDLGMPRARGRALIAVARAVADGTLDLEPGADRQATREALVAVPGIGPWTADYIRMRALGDPDVLLETDLIVRRTLDSLSIRAAQTERWRPWRSYAAMYLWRANATLTRSQQ